MGLKNYTNWRFIYAKKNLCDLSSPCLISRKKVSPKTTFFIPYEQKPKGMKEKRCSLHQTSRNPHFNMRPTRLQLRTIFRFFFSFLNYPVFVKKMLNSLKKFQKKLNTIHFFNKGLHSNLTGNGINDTCKIYFFHYYSL